MLISNTRLSNCAQLRRACAEAEGTSLCSSGVVEAWSGSPGTIWDRRAACEALPHYDTIQRGHAFGNLSTLKEGAELHDGNFLFKVGRPKETECPPPSVVIEQWLKPGWQTATAEPQVHEERRSKATGKQEEFDASAERVLALEDWQATRNEWAASEKHVQGALGIFSNLFDLWGRFARESEKYQLLLADGILSLDGPDGRIRHPILLQRVQLSFNPRVPEFSLRGRQGNSTQ